MNIMDGSNLQVMGDSSKQVVQLMRRLDRSEEEVPIVRERCWGGIVILIKNFLLLRQVVVNGKVTLERTKNTLGVYVGIVFVFAMWLLS